MPKHKTLNILKTRGPHRWFIEDCILQTMSAKARAQMDMSSFAMIEEQIYEEILDAVDGRVVWYGLRETYGGATHAE